MALTGEQWAGLGIGGAGLTAGLFAGNQNSTALTGAIGDLKTSAKSASKSGTDLLATGSGGMDAVIKRLTALTSGNLADIMAETQPERTRVLDQYDTARSKTVRDTPRGGGLAATMGKLNAAEASDLTTLTNKARSDATKDLASASATLAGEGLSAMSLSSQDLSSVVSAYLGLNQQDKQSASAFGQGLGALLGIFLA